MLAKNKNTITSYSVDLTEGVFIGGTITTTTTITL